MSIFKDVELYHFKVGVLFEAQCMTVTNTSKMLLTDFILG